MTASYGGFDKPKGDPGALRAIGNSVKSAVSSVASSGSKVSGVASGSTDWQGAGATSFRSQADALAGMGQKAVAAADQFASEIDSYASKLQALQDRWQADVTALQGDAGIIDGFYAQVSAAVQAQNTKNANAYSKALAAAKAPSANPLAAGSNPLAPIAATLPAPPATIPPPTKPNTSPMGIVSGQAVVQIEQWPSTYASVPGLGGLGGAISTVEHDIQRARQDLIHLEAEYKALKASAAGRFGGISTSVGSITTAASAINVKVTNTGGAAGPYARRAGDPPIPLNQYAWVKIKVQPGDNLSTIGASFYGNGSGYSGIMKKVMSNPSTSQFTSNPNLIDPGQTFTLSQTPGVPIPVPKTPSPPKAPVTDWSRSPAVGEMRAMAAAEPTPQTPPHDPPPPPQSSPPSPSPSSSSSSPGAGLTAAQLQMASSNNFTLGTHHQTNGATVSVTVNHNSSGQAVGLTSVLVQPSNVPGHPYSQTAILTFATGQVNTVSAGVN